MADGNTCARIRENSVPKIWEDNPTLVHSIDVLGLRSLAVVKHRIVSENKSRMLISIFFNIHSQF